MSSPGRAAPARLVPGMLALGGLATLALHSAVASGGPATGSAAVALADTVVRVWGSAVTASAGERATMQLLVDMTESGALLGLIRGRARFAPTLLNFEGAEAGDADGVLALDTERAEAGVLGFELRAEDRGGVEGRAVLAEVTFWIMAAPGGLAPVALELDALEAVDGSDLLDRAEVVEGTVLVR